MAIYYKLKCLPRFKVMKIDGNYITVKEVKSNLLDIYFPRKDIDLQITNFNTKEVLEDKDLIPKNTSVCFSRIPKEPEEKNQKRVPKDQRVEVVEQENAGPQYMNPDLSSLQSETERIDAAIYQSTIDYQRVNFRTAPMRTVPRNYVCHNCHVRGHFIQDCPLRKEGKRVRRSSGLPLTFMETVSGPEVEGAMITANGTYVRRRSPAETSTVSAAGSSNQAGPSRVNHARRFTPYH